MSNITEETAYAAMPHALSDILALRRPRLFPLRAAIEGNPLALCGWS